MIFYWLILSIVVGIVSTTSMCMTTVTKCRWVETSLLVALIVETIIFAISTVMSSTSVIGVRHGWVIRWIVVMVILMRLQMIMVIITIIMAVLVIKRRRIVASVGIKARSVILVNFRFTGTMVVPIQLINFASELLLFALGNFKVKLDIYHFKLNKLSIVKFQNTFHHNFNYCDNIKHKF